MWHDRASVKHLSVSGTRTNRIESVHFFFTSIKICLGIIRHHEQNKYMLPSVLKLVEDIVIPKHTDNQCSLRKKNPIFNTNVEPLRCRNQAFS